MAKVYVFLANGFEDVEALIPIDVLRRGGADVVTVSIVEDSQVVETAHGVQIVADAMFDDCDYSDADLLMLPGGMPGASNLYDHKGVCKAVLAQFQAGKKVSAICAAPAVVLGKTKIPAGKKWTCYPGMEGESKAEYQNGYSNKVFVTDGNLVTSRGPGAAEEFSMELVRILAGEEMYRKVHGSAQMR